MQPMGWTSDPQRYAVLHRSTCLDGTNTDLAASDKAPPENFAGSLPKDRFIVSTNNFNPSAPCGETRPVNYTENSIADVSRPISKVFNGTMHCTNDARLIEANLHQRGESLHSSHRSLAPDMGETMKTDPVMRAPPSYGVWVHGFWQEAYESDYIKDLFSRCGEICRYYHPPNVNYAYVK